MMRKLLNLIDWQHAYGGAKNSAEEPAKATIVMDRGASSISLMFRDQPEEYEDVGVMLELKDNQLVAYVYTEEIAKGAGDPMKVVLIEDVKNYVSE